MKVNFGDLFSLIRPDWIILIFASIALTLAAGGQVLIPHYTGKVVDSIAINDNLDSLHHYLFLLVFTAIFTAVFTGIRGGLFTVVGIRANVRIRTMLFNSLLNQEIGFFDMNKTGDVISRLTSDTQKVADQVYNII